MTFAEAVSVFSDERGLLLDDPEHSSLDEDRFVLIGLSRTPRILVVVHCYRAADHEIRLISARRATPRERAAYARGWAPES